MAFFSKGFYVLSVFGHFVFQSCQPIVVWNRSMLLALVLRSIAFGVSWTAQPIAVQLSLYL